MSGIVEIRDYTIEPQHFPAYQKWASELAAPFLMKAFDVIDFWLDDGIPSEVTGSNPKVSENGQAQVCWIIRWPDMETRQAQFVAGTRQAEWQEIWDQHPCPDGYLEMNVRFMRSYSA